MPKPPVTPFEELIDRLTGMAADYAGNLFRSAAGELKTRIGRQIGNLPPHPPFPVSKPLRRVKGVGKVGGKGRKGGPSAPKTPKLPRTTPPPVRTAYTVLGVTPDADQEVLVAAYKAMVKKWHPDRNPGDNNAVERMKELNAAWELLKDPVKRETYNRGMGL